MKTQGIDIDISKAIHSFSRKVFFSPKKGGVRKKESSSGLDSFKKTGPSMMPALLHELEVNKPRIFGVNQSNKSRCQTGKKTCLSSTKETKCENHEPPGQVSLDHIGVLILRDSKWTLKVSLKLFDTFAYTSAMAHV